MPSTNYSKLLKVAEETSPMRKEAALPLAAILLAPLTAYSAYTTAKDLYSGGKNLAKGNIKKGLSDLTWGGIGATGTVLTGGWANMLARHGAQAMARQGAQLAGKKALRQAEKGTLSLKEHLNELDAIKHAENINPLKAQLKTLAPASNEYKELEKQILDMEKNKGKGFWHAVERPFGYVNQAPVWGMRKMFPEASKTWGENLLKFTESAPMSLTEKISVNPYVWLPQMGAEMLGPHVLKSRPSITGTSEDVPTT